MRSLLLALGLLVGLSSAEIPESCYSHVDVRTSFVFCWIQSKTNF